MFNPDRENDRYFLIQTEISNVQSAIDDYLTKCGRSGKYCTISYMGSNHSLGSLELLEKAPIRATDPRVMIAEADKQMKLSRALEQCRIAIKNNIIASCKQDRDLSTIASHVQILVDLLRENLDLPAVQAAGVTRSNFTTITMEMLEQLKNSLDTRLAFIARKVNQKNRFRF